MTVIKIKNSSVSGKTPAAGDLQTAELALNTADKKLYSKDTNGNVFEIGAGGDVPSGGTGDRPDSPTAGDLFFDTDLGALLYWDGSAWVEVGSGGSEVIVSDTPPATTDLEEGTLWWNSDPSELQLYVLYLDADPNTLVWVEASPMPGPPEGYPSLPDGGTLDERYVQVSGDNMTGALTIGPDGGPAVTTLAADGSATFAGAIDSGASDLNSYALFIQNSRGDRSTIISKNNSTGNVFEGRNGSNAGTSFIKNDGTATFAGQMRIGNDIASGNGTRIYDNGAIYLRSDVSSDNSIFKYYSNGFTDNDVKINFKADGSAEFAGSIISGGFDLANSNTNGVRILASGALQLQRQQGANNSARFEIIRGTNDKTVEIYSDGSATFSGIVDVERLNAGSLSHTTPAITATTETTSDAAVYSRNNAGTTGACYVAAGGDGSAKATINNDGSASFASNVTTQGSVVAVGGVFIEADLDSNRLSTSSRGTSSANLWFGNSRINTSTFSVIWTEPENPANYTTTTDAEGNTTQVYNGPTLDVKERLESAHETFQELLIAVQNATDFGELKAAMLVALEDYSA